MNIEANKQVKLQQVYSELTTIKNQLHSLIQPSKNQSNNSTLVKINILQSGQSSPNNKSFHKGKQQSKNGQPEKRYYQMKQINTDQMTNTVQKKYVKSVENDTFRQKVIPSQTLKNNSKVALKQGLVDYASKTAQRLKKQLKCMPKIHFSPIKQQTQTPSVFSPQKGNIKKPSHTRHVSYNDNIQTKQKDMNKNGSILKKQQNQDQRNMFTFNNKGEHIQDNNNPKRLKRMRSDFAGFPSSNMHENKAIPFSLGDKVKEMQEQLKKKDKAIDLLCSQLHYFETSFKQLQQNLWNIIRGSSGKTKKKDIDISQVLKEVFRDMELQNGELARLNIQCQKWRKLNLEQEQQLQKLEQRLRNVGKSDESILKLKSECERYKQERAALASKLQVAVNENQLKDDFIVKLLSSKSNNEEGKSKETAEMLKKYMSACNYPKNRLLQKLTEQTSQIQRLKAIIGQHKR